MTRKPHFVKNIRRWTSPDDNCVRLALAADACANQTCANQTCAIQNAGHGLPAEAARDRWPHASIAIMKLSLAARQ
jgi:hypothetical protein